MDIVDAFYFTGTLMFTLVSLFFVLMAVAGIMLYQKIVRAKTKIDMSRAKMDVVKSGAKVLVLQKLMGLLS